MNKEEVKQLLERYSSGKASEEEKALVESWYIHHSPNVGDHLPDEAIQDDLKQILESLPGAGGHRTRTLWPLIGVTAALLIVFSFGLFFLSGSESAEITTSLPRKLAGAGDIPPGGQKAILTLSDGSEIVLDDASSGEIAGQANVRITKTSDGQLIYTLASEGTTINTQPAYNMIKTPRGGQYAVVLPDGTRVWLNAASSLRYPAIFTGNSRKVELTGEAYFEVAHNKSMPFSVVSSTQTVEVLGTHFNVNTYSDEPAVRTTLLEGSVKVSHSAGSQILEPGQQLQLASTARVVGVDTEDAVAWKNGDFIFRDEELASIMRQVAKWYDVDVEFNNTVSKQMKFSGLVSRSRNISAVLRLMELTNQVHFKVEGRRIIVMP